MTQAEAAKLVAKLFAAFPFHRDNDQLTVAVYVEQFTRLHDPALALEAVNNVIAGSRYLPPVADIRDAYESAREQRVRRSELVALNEAPLTDEERAEGARRAREFAERLARRLNDRDGVFRGETEADIEEKRRRALSL